MAPVRLSIHIPPDSNPTNTTALVAELATKPGQDFGSASQLLEYLSVQGIGSRTEIHSTSTSLGILNRTEQAIHLSPDGLALASIREDVRGDILHFLMYTGWSPNVPTEFLQSWAYRIVCDQYWERSTVILTSRYLDAQVGEVINIAQEFFPQIGVSNFDEVSFSRKSLRGAHNWLEAVTPPVISVDDQQQTPMFSRRSFCPPELVLLAVAHVLGQEENVLGIDVLLTPEKRESISRICLLDPNTLDRVLDWAIPIYPHLIAPGTTAGFYGRFIRLHQFPELRDVVR